MKILWLLGEDLRLTDNEILEHAEGHELAVAWFASPSFQRAKNARLAYGIAAIGALRDRLKEKQIDLLGPQKMQWEFSELARLVRQLRIDRIEVTRSWGTEELELIQKLATLGVEVQVRDQNSLLPLSSSDPERNLTEEIFSHWRRRIQSQITPKVARLSAFPKPIEVDLDFILPLSTPESRWLHSNFAFTEEKARQHLDAYFLSDAPARYAETRNGLMRWGDSTKLSPYLAWGLLSPHAVLRALFAFEKNKGANASTEHLLMELLWREYFRRILSKKGAELFKKNRGKRDFELFNSWLCAQTGEPFVDAPMIEFERTGWMSNRSRQVTASFLTKTWNVDWKWGASAFESGLIDYDVHSNWGNWAYVAGVGQDPRDRVFNPRTQAERYDPDGTYQRHWLSRRSNVRS